MKKNLLNFLKSFGLFATKSTFVFVLVMLTVLITIVQAQTLIQKDIETRRTVSVNGIATIDAVPNEVEVSMGIELVGIDPIDMQNNVNPKVNAIVQNLKDFGIKDENIKTSEYRLANEYNYNTQLQELKLTATINVIIDNLTPQDTRVGEVIKIGFDNGFNRINNISYGFADIDSIREDLKNQAIADARSKKSELEQTLGLKLGNIVDVDLSNLYGYRSTYNVADSYSYAIEERAVAAPIQIQLGSETIREEVTLVYEIL